MGLLLQAPERQLCHLSVAEDIAFGPENLTQPRERIQGIVRDVARLLNLEPLLTRSPHTLSSGEAQRVALAATLALDQPVLAFDQPTAHLDERSRRTFYQLVARLCREEGKIVIIAETDLLQGDLEPLATQVLDLSPAGRPPPVGRRSTLAALASASPTAGAAHEPLLELAGLSFAYTHGQPALTIEACDIKAG